MRSQLTLRLGAFYACIFSVLGVFLVFWPVWLEERGFDSDEIAWLLAIGIWVRAIAGPIWGQWTDRCGNHKATMIALACFATLACSVFLLRLEFWPLALVTALLSISYPPLIPLVDSMTIRAGRLATGAVDYGRVRLWGSLSFLVTSTAVGAFLEGRSSEWVIPCMLATLVATGIAGVWLPRSPAPERDLRADARAPIHALLGVRPFVVLLLCVGCIQGSHACYYAFASVHWQDADISRTVIGMLWSEGVIAEVVLFAVAGRAVPWRPSTLLLVGACAAAVRWVCIAESTAVSVLVGVQWLHALSFGATHLAAVRWIAKHVDGERTATAQTLLAAVSAGLGPGLATPLAGVLFHRYGGGAFYAMSAIALLGLCLAIALRRGAKKVSESKPPGQTPDGE